jgi:hypothetical protein
MRSFKAWSAVVAATTLISLSALPAHAATAPPSGQTLLGVYSWNVSAFEAATSKDHAVRSRFVDWDPSTVDGETWKATIAAAESSGMTLDVHWAPERWTANGPAEVLSPGGIARGEGDATILTAATELRAAQGPVLLRWAAEMNAWWHHYGAYDKNGDARGGDHTTAAYIAAWRRVRTIFRGGSHAEVSAALAALGQPPLAVPDDGQPVGAPGVNFVWTPNAGSQPNVGGNHWNRYYPGDAYVDWVGVDVYNDTEWPLLSRLLDEHYEGHPSKPFTLSEWGLLEEGDDPAFVHHIFDWVERRPRVGLIEWFDSGDSLMSANPRSAAAYRRRSADPRYLSAWPAPGDPAQGFVDPNAQPPGDIDHTDPNAVATASAEVQVSRRPTRVRRGVAPVRVRCKRVGSRCVGVLSLRSVGSKRRGGGRRLGRARFSIAPGAKRTVRVRLSRRNQRFVGRFRKVSVVAEAKLHQAQAPRPTKARFALLRSHARAARAARARRARR